MTQMYVERFIPGEEPVFTAVITDVAALGRTSLACKWSTINPAGVQTDFVSGSVEGDARIEPGDSDNVWHFIHPTITSPGRHQVRFVSTQGLVAAAEMEIEVQHSAFV